MNKNEEISEKIDYIKKFISQMEKSFDDAKTCRRCNESCGDIFYNGYGKTIVAIDFIENALTELFEELESESFVVQLESIEEKKKKPLN